ncbi:flagellar biosynthesis protein FlhB [Sporolactobacillus vineae]|uniref:flagellar biosynthesis protein FlhB n=1 Tax=Sporolactobacillus vineae TaxID=444463 RepID=UPI00028846B4|nr:flagellar biosynthesis protein FlhB [Sporolactobacillus vineae]
MATFRFKLNLRYFDGEKTEKATPHKRQESRKKGNVFKSLDLCTAVSLLAFFIYFKVAGATFGGNIASLVAHIYRDQLNLDLTENNIQRFFYDLSVRSVGLLIPVLVVALVAGAAGQILQIGFLFTPENILFKPERISFLKGLKRVYSFRAVMELFKSILKILVIGLVAFTVIWFNRQPVVESAEKPLNAGLATMAGIVVNMGLFASVTLIALAMIDYFYQRFDYEKNLRMSKQDIKDEYKNMEGDPKVKSRIRERQKQMAMHRMMQEVPQADVVITNPTHFAVALRYDAKKMTSPQVVARGADSIAFRIKTVARENGVAIVEKKPLARALYFQLNIGDSIPEQFFQAVAEILAYVYRLTGKA